MAINLLFETHIMTLMHTDGTIVARDLSCQLDTVNLPWNMEVAGLIPTDQYDLYSNGWTSHSLVSSSTNGMRKLKHGVRIPSTTG